MTKALVTSFLVLVVGWSVVTAQRGTWSPVQKWPLIPVAIFHLDDNRVLGFSSLKPDDFNNKGLPNEDKYISYTYAAIFDPVTRTFERVDLPGHDMFCAALTFLPNGDLFAGGGGNGDNAFRVSTFDMSAKKWIRWPTFMNSPHWYGSAVSTGQTVWVALGTKNKRRGTTPTTFIPEISSGYNFLAPWKNLYGSDMEGKGPGEGPYPPWYPQVHLLKDGRILESGTQNNMFVIDWKGTGSIKYVGKRNTLRDEGESWGASTIMFRKNMLMSFGGLENFVSDRATKQGTHPRPVSLRRVIEIDASNPNSIKTKRLPRMNYNRGFQNAVLVPNGDVYVFGGHNNGLQFDDSGSVLVPEYYNAETKKWKKAAPMKVPRNYHSVAILLYDATIVVGGGGLCGNCAWNHQDHEIFTPPYLYTASGQLQRRPRISASPATVKHGQRFQVVMRGFAAKNISYFRWIRHYSLTHSISTDQRGFKAQIVKGAKQQKNGSWRYILRTPGNKNEFPLGNWFLFAVKSGGVPSKAKTIKIVP